MTLQVVGADAKQLIEQGRSEAARSKILRDRARSCSLGGVAVVGQRRRRRVQQRSAVLLWGESADEGADDRRGHAARACDVGQEHVIVVDLDELLPIGENIMFACCRVSRTTSQECSREALPVIATTFCLLRAKCLTIAYLSAGSPALSTPRMS